MTTPGYGFENATSAPGSRLPWQRVSEVIATARNYWIGTAGPDGRPHAAPVWGVWLDDLLYFSTGKESRKARNLALNPNTCIHIESPGGEIVIIEGRSREMSDASVLRPAWDLYNAKYSWNAEAYPFYVMRPSIAYSFKEDLGEAATRWQFAE
jgi:nitroimidazol reductase NimA-like FMN-containing flavoprotein (pyridoxamine 5'-phosphate oxidase superfamily)